MFYTESYKKTAFNKYSVKKKNWRKISVLSISSSLFKCNKMLILWDNFRLVISFIFLIKYFFLNTFTVFYNGDKTNLWNAAYMSLIYHKETQILKNKIVVNQNSYGRLLNKVTIHIHKIYCIKSKNIM